MKNFSETLGITTGVGIGLVVALIILVMTFCLLCVGGGLLSFFFLSVESNRVSIEESTASIPRQRPGPTVIFESPAETIATVREDVTVGNIRWRVVDAQTLGPLLPSNDELREDMTTEGKFVYVRFEIENQSEEARPLENFELVDAQGKSYQEPIGTMWYIDEREKCLEPLNPGSIQICSRVFELPTEATQLKLKVDDLRPTTTYSKLIDLALEGSHSPPEESIPEQSPSPEESIQEQPPPGEESTALEIIPVQILSPVSQGERGRVEIQTTPGANCSIEVMYSSGPSTAEGLEPQQADESGTCLWEWEIGPDTSAGEWPIEVIVSLNNQESRLSSKFTIQ